DLANTSLEALRLNYPDHPSLVDGEFVPREKEADNRSWLAKATLGLIESDTPLPPGQTRAGQDVLRQYQEAEDQIPSELLPENQPESSEEAEQPAEQSGRSWWSYMTFGLFD